MMLMAIIVGASVFGYLGDSSYAADPIFIMDQYGTIVDPAVPIEMRTSSLQLTMGTEGQAYDDERYRVVWSIEDKDQEAIATLEPGGSSHNKTICIVRALSPGDVTVTVTVYDSMDGDSVIGSTTCNIRVVFSVDTTTDDSIYKYVNATDTERSLVLYADSPEVDLGLNFGDASNTQWTSANNEVVTVEQRTGRVKPVGSGKTQVTATYTPEGAGDTTYTAYLNVYVIPQVSGVNGGPYGKVQDITINSGESIFTDSVFTNNLETIQGKIVCVVKMDDGRGNSTIVADSLDHESEIFSIYPPSSRSNELRITGKAGEYDMYFYTYGTYDPKVENGTASYMPTVVHLTIKGDIEDKNVILHKGWSYDFAEAYNMTVEEFKSCFTVKVTTSNGGSIANYADYNDSTVTLTANNEAELKATLSVKSGRELAVKRLMGLQDDAVIPSSFITNISIVEGFYLDRSNLILSVGQAQQLNAIIEGTYNGTVTWESSNPTFVTVNDSGLVQGKRVTTQDVTITAVMHTEDGTTKRATCIVKVEAAVQDFKLNPDKKQEMSVGEHLTVVANIKQTVSVAPLHWFSTDTSVFTVAASEDKKSVVITAVGGGEATLVAQNTANENDRQTLKIVVRVPITGISFTKQDLSIELYKNGYNMRNVVSYTPKNTTDAKLVWASADTSIVTLDEDGYMTLRGAGTTLVSVYPEYNPNNVMASILVTVIGTPESISVSESDVTMNVRESKMIEMNLTPKNTAVDMKWTPDKTGIVDVSYDAERKIATLTGRAPGTTVINIVTSNSLITNVRVNVTQPSTGLTISPKALTLRTGGRESLTAVLRPANSTDTITWTSLDTSIARVNNTGDVTGIKSGTTFIRAQAYNGSVAGPVDIIQVTVQDGVTGVSLDSTVKTVNVGSSITVSPIFTPVTAFDKSMTWTIHDTSIAKVENSDGSDAVVTGIAVGTTLLTGTSTDGGFSVACLIRVNPKPVANNTKVTVTPATKFLKVGKTFYVTATVTGTSNKKVKWTSSKKSVATVTAAGKVKGKKIGTAYITATAQDGSGATARCKVRVVRMVKKLKLNKSSATVLVGNTIKLKAKATPKNATIKKVAWSTSDQSIAEVDSTGRVLGVAEGIVKITARATDGSNKKVTCIVQVREPVEATGVTVANSEITVAKGRAAQSGIVASPANTTSSIRYYSDNKKVATVDKRGKIRTKRVGQATIYGETSNGKRGFCDVLVVDLNRKGLVMRQYDTETLRVNEISNGVTWYSKNVNIATVSSSGVVTGRRKGTTTIYAIVNGIKLGCRVRIKKIK